MYTGERNSRKLNTIHIQCDQRMKNILQHQKIQLRIQLKKKINKKKKSEKSVTIIKQTNNETKKLCRIRYNLTNRSVHLKNAEEWKDQYWLN